MSSNSAPIDPATKQRQRAPMQQQRTQFQLQLKQQQGIARENALKLDFTAIMPDAKV